MSGNDESPSIYFVDSLQLTNFILDSRTTCRMTLQVSYFIPGPLEYTDKHIEVVDGYRVTAKQKVQVQIKLCDDNEDIFIMTFPNLILTPDLCNGVIFNYYVNEFGTCLFISQKFLDSVLWQKVENTVILPDSAQRKHEFWGGIKQMSTSKKIVHRKKVALGLLHHILGHRSTKSLMAGDTENVLKDIELRIVPDHFCTSSLMESDFVVVKVMSLDYGRWAFCCRPAVATGDTESEA